jgi:hypothetical protein
MKSFKNFVEQAKWRKNSSLHKTPDWYENEIGSQRDDYDRWKSSKHDGGKPKQSVADTPTKYGSLNNRPTAGRGYSTIKKDGKLSKTGVNRLKARIKARND